MPVVVAGVFGILIAPLISRMLPLFPPVVTGTIITVIGISLMRVGINWAAGGNPTIMSPTGPVPNPAYGAPLHLAVSAVVLVSILLITKFVKGFFANIAVLSGIVIGMIIAMTLGKVSFGGLEAAPWVAVVKPFQFGMPTFNPVAIITMCLVVVVVMIESLGMFLALSNITGKKLSQRELSDGLRVDGLGTLIGGIFNTFPYTSFSQNVGLVGVTGVRSRWVCAAGGMVCATGIRILGGVDFQKNRHNLYVVAIGVGFGMIPLVADKFFSQMPKALSPLLGSGILLASIMAVLLNFFFNQVKSTEKAKQESAGATLSPDA